MVATELEALGMPRGPKFDQVVNDVFAAQLNGRGKTPEEREKILRKLSGIKEPPKKKEKEKKPAKGGEKARRRRSCSTPKKRRRKTRRPGKIQSLGQACPAAKKKSKK